MDLFSIYQNVEQIIDRVKLSELFPGFRRYKFALYNARAICFNGAMLSYDERFKGNTSIEFCGEYIAIRQITSQSDLDLDILAYELVHEMHHCYQQEKAERRFPDDLKLLNRPLDIDFYTLKHEENRCLALAYINGDKDSFRKFYEIRNFRLDKFSKYSQEELKAETIEGISEFIGLSALKRISLTKWQSHIDKYLRIITNDISLLFDIRQAAYFSGAILCLTLDKFGYTIRNEYNEQTFYEQNLLYRGNSNFSVSQTDDIYLELQNSVENDKRTIAAMIHKMQWTEFSARIVGYDPMNMIRVDELIFCRNFVELQNEREKIVLNIPTVLKLKSNCGNDIVGYYS